MIVPRQPVPDSIPGNAVPRQQFYDSVMGKSGQEIMALYGKPDSSSDSGGSLRWVYDRRIHDPNDGKPDRWRHTRRRRWPCPFGEFLGGQHRGCRVSAGSIDVKSGRHLADLQNFQSFSSGV